MEEPSAHIVDLDQYITIEDEKGFFKSIPNRGNKENPISVETYSNDFQEETNPIIYLSDDDEEEETQNQPFKKRFKIEKGESSNPKPIFCAICMEPKSPNESFEIQSCSHAYCIDCTIKYVASKLQTNAAIITCPETGCAGFLEPETCRSILPKEVFDRWVEVLCEWAVVGSMRFYCPYEDCSALMIDDGVEVIRESECPYCRRFFCAQCKVPWHSGIGCEEFQKLGGDERGKEDLMVRELAKKNQWKRCPQCKFYVERSSGCSVMRCRCGLNFCYTCGSSYTNHRNVACRRVLQLQTPLPPNLRATPSLMPFTTARVPTILQHPFLFMGSNARVTPSSMPFTTTRISTVLQHPNGFSHSNARVTPSSMPFNATGVSTILQHPDGFPYSNARVTPSSMPFTTTEASTIQQHPYGFPRSNER